MKVFKLEIIFGNVRKTWKTTLLEMLENLQNFYITKVTHWENSFSDLKKTFLWYMVKEKKSLNWKKFCWFKKIFF